MDAGHRGVRVADAEGAKDDSMENEALTNELKNQAMSMAREWLDYARASEQPLPTIRLAREMCASAAGTVDACQ